MRRLPLAVAVVLSVPALAGAGHELPPPLDVVSLTVGGTTQQVGAYTYQAPADATDPDVEKRNSDPVNLVFVGTDPREIRQALLALNGVRPAFPGVAPFTCRWIDAMGYDQGAWGENEGWVGGVVQLACTDPAAPFGNPFRYHLRLFRQGGLTLGAAHFEFLITNTAEHEVLGWNAARDFVVYDMGRTGRLTAAPGAAPMSFPGQFRAVRRPVYDGLVAGGAAGILGYAGLPVPPPGPGDVKMPLSPVAYVLTASIPFKPVQAKTTTPFEVTYNIVVPKPFCGTPADYVKLEGPLQFLLRVHTNPSGMFSRTYSLSGSLTVTPLVVSGSSLVPAGAPLPAIISEYHQGLLTNNYQEVTEQAGKTLLGTTQQSLTWSLKLGQQDGLIVNLSCGAP